MKKILIIDDERSIVESLSAILEDEGYSVDTSYTGEEAEKRVLTLKPDLLLLDVLISGTDGRDICKQIRQNPQIDSVPIIMISAHPNMREGTLQAGATEFIAKPFDIDYLLEKIDTLLSA